MLKIDETCITKVERDDRGTWIGRARFGDTIVDCLWIADTEEEKAEEWRHVTRHIVDCLHVSAIRDLITNGQRLGLTAGDLVYAIRAADRINDLDIDGILSHAWEAGLLKTVALVGEEEVAA